MPARKPLKFPVTLTIEMSPDQVDSWAREYLESPEELTPGQLLEAVRDDVTGYLLTLAREHHVPDGQRWTATARARRTPVNRHTRKPVSPEHVTEIHRLRAQGLSIRDIAARVHISRWAVNRVLSPDAGTQMGAQGYTSK